MIATLDRYKPPEDDDIINMLRGLIAEFYDYLHYGLGYADGQYFICGLDLVEIIIRVDRRLKYFSYFHGMKINDKKKAALYAYWIVKLRPVRIVDESLGNKIDHSKVNEKLAANHLINVLVHWGKIKLWDGHEGVRFDDKNQFLKELCYSLRFRNLTIDSMIVLADAVNTQSFL